LSSPFGELIGKEIEPKFQEYVSIMTDEYQTTWKKAIDCLLEVNAMRKTISNQKIKEKFKVFFFFFFFFLKNK